MIKKCILIHEHVTLFNGIMCQLLVKIEQEDKVYSWLAFLPPFEYLVTTLWKGIYKLKRCHVCPPIKSSWMWNKIANEE